MRSRTLFRLLVALILGAGAAPACEPTTGPTDPDQLPRPNFPSVMDADDLRIPEQAVDSLETRG